MMKVDVIQAGLLIAERQRKCLRFNLRVFGVAWRDDSCKFASIRSDDRHRKEELVAELEKALAANLAEQSSPVYWENEIQAHVATMGMYSKLYGSGVVVFSALAVAVSIKGSWLYLLASGLIPAILAMAKWGIDKYMALLTRISAALIEIKSENANKDDTIDTPPYTHIRSTSCVGKRLLWSSAQC